MVVLDTSAVVAIALGEPESAPFEDVIAAADEVLIGAPTAVECGIVLSVRAGGPLETWLSAVGAVVVPFTQEHAQEARRAWLRYGRGSGSSDGELASRLDAPPAVVVVVDVASDPPLARSRLKRSRRYGNRRSR